MRVYRALLDTPGFYTAKFSSPFKRCGECVDLIIEIKNRKNNFLIIPAMAISCVLFIGCGNNDDSNASLPQLTPVNLEH
jgi:hypothetical protein